VILKPVELLAETVWRADVLDQLPEPTDLGCDQQLLVSKSC
jgi:hypothetical protein